VIEGYQASAAPLTMSVMKPYDRMIGGAPRILTSSPKQSRLPGRVVERAISDTRNSLKSQVGQRLKSPFSTTRAITPKLYSYSRPTALQNYPASKSQLRARSILDSARRASNVPLPAISSFRVLRKPASACAARSSRAGIRKHSQYRK
jgi:hypothetical protein